MEISIKKPLNFDNYTFRCSSLYKIMGEAKVKSSQSKIDDKQCEINELQDKMNLVEENKKSGKAYINQQTKMQGLVADLAELKSNHIPDQIILPETCTSYLIECYVAKKFDLKKDIFSKYMEKGKAKESEAIDLLNEVHDKFYLSYREVCENSGLPYRKFNDYIEGEVDILYEEPNLRKVIDIKNSWDLFTFYSKIKDEMMKAYKFQGVGYCELENANEFQIVYTLMNMPENLIQDECKRILYQLGSDMENSPIYEQACKEFIKKCTFDNLNVRERIFDELSFKRDRNEYLSVVERIKICRKWLNEYAKKDFIRVYGIEAYNACPKEKEEICEVLPFVELIEVVKPPKPIIVKQTISNEEAIEKLAQEVFSSEEIQEIVDEHSNEEPNYLDISLIENTINSIDNIQDLRIYFGEIGGNELSEEIRQLFANKENELPQDSNSHIEEVEVIEEISTHNGETATTTEPYKTSSIIENLSTEQSCIDLWKKQETQLLFKEFPQLKEELLNKRASFKEQQVIVTEPTNTATKKPTITKTAAPTTDPIEVKIVLLKSKFLLCKTDLEVKDFYKLEENKDFINENKNFIIKPENVGFKKWIENLMAERKNNPLTAEVKVQEEDTSLM
jgi:hypothetical protein